MKPPKGCMSRGKDYNRTKAKTGEPNREELLNPRPVAQRVNVGVTLHMSLHVIFKLLTHVGEQIKILIYFKPVSIRAIH